MRWPSRRARLNEVQWQRTNGALSTTVLELRRELKTKQQYASRLEFLLHQRNERIDQLQGQVEQLRLKNNQSQEAEHMAMFVGLILDLSERSEESFGTVAAKQSMGCAIG